MLTNLLYSDGKIWLKHAMTYMYKQAMRNIKNVMNVGIAE